MREWLRKCWPAIKILLASAILAAVIRRFLHDLHSNPDLWLLAPRPGWLVLSGVLYLLGLGLSNLYWYRLMRHVGEEPSPSGAVRAYYLGHLAKYLPGKAWALVVRSSLAGQAGVHLGIAALTAFYEVLVTMASGVLLAALLFVCWGLSADIPLDGHILRTLFLFEDSADPLDWKVLVLFSLGLSLAVLGPILPPIFNRLMYRLSLPFRDRDATPLPHIDWAALLEGLAVTALGWLLLGLSFVAVLQGVMSPTPQWDLPLVARLTAYLGAAYVAGFVIVVVPSGLGVREYFLILFLVPELLPYSDSPSAARALVILLVLLLRLIWTAAELVIAALVYWLPGKSRAD